MEETFYTPDSSNIVKIKYYEDNYILEVEFQNGGIYHYYDVPIPVWENFKASDSKGKFLHEHIKGNYRYSKV
jgi:hypothetical protein